VSMPFDFHNDDHPEGLASARVRMMQPYAGKGRGMQFPMAKGTEVLLTFVDGDPDRPLIAGAINTAAAPGPVTADNQTESVIQTGGNNRIRMEDKEGTERMVLESPAANSWVRIGTTNDPITLNGAAIVRLELTQTYADPGAVGEPETGVTATPITTILTKQGDATFSGFEADMLGNEGIYTYTYQSGADTAKRKVYVGASIEATKDVSGIRVRTAGVSWSEGMGRVGSFIGGPPPAPAILSQRVSSGPTHNDPEQIGNMIGNFGAAYRPTGLLTRYNDKDTGKIKGLTWDQAIADAHVSVSSMDTFNTQEGNIYDFGGYWNYNLGNSYVENHIDQTAALNQDQALASTITDTYKTELATLEAQLVTLKKEGAHLDGIYAREEPYDFDVDGDGDRNVDVEAVAKQADITAKEAEIKQKKLAKPFKPVHDLLNVGGPKWSSIIWPTGTVC
jgi:hypothetical protein